jgi:drug/metabolite transporter (DMT)-like permease
MSDSTPRPARSNAAPADAGPSEWALLALLIALGGSSFTFIHAAIETAPPAAVATGRLWIAAVALYIAMRVKGRRFPPFLVRTNKGIRPHRLWVWMAAVGLVGYAVPFLIFPWAQQYVESGLAGVYMSFMPLWTLGLAHLFADEPLTRRRIAGFGLGFLGVLILMGPEAIAGAAASSVLAQAGLLLATLLYAASAVLSRRAPPARPRVFSAGIVLMGAAFATPSLLFADPAVGEWSAKSLASVVILGLGPTALAGLIIIMIIRRAGAGFMALANYVTPLVAVLLGALIYGERLEPSALLALIVILAGVAVSQSRTRPALAAGDAEAADLEAIAARGQKSS